MTKPVDGFFQSIQPVADQVATAVSGSVSWLSRTVQDLTRNLPLNVAPVAQLALTVAPFVIVAILLPRKLVVFTLGAAAAIAFLAIFRK